MTTVFFTGAGISASAGIATYRDGGSSWRDPELEKKSHSSRYGNHLPELWDNHWGPLSLQMLSAEPTHAHRAIAAHGGMVVTQNIDNFHERAGSPEVSHLHGIMEAICMRCKSTEIAKYQVLTGSPKCLDCDSYKTRPNAILFGEMLSRKLFKQVNQAMVDADTIVVVGSSLNVQPAAGLVMDAIGRKRTILINKEPVMFSKWFTETHYGNADDLIDGVLETL
jgi:NAD-dependent deacetylase